MSDSEAQRRRRWISLGELVAIAALAVSAFGVWISWKNSSEEKPTRVVEQRQPIPLTLRGIVEDDGQSLEISPVEQSHALQSLTIAIRGSAPIEVGSDGRLSAGDTEALLKDHDKDRKGAHAVPVRIDARYVEMGTDRRSSANYVLRYRWEGGGLFAGRSLRIVSLSRG